MTREEELEVEMQGGIAAFLEKGKDRFVGYNRLASEINTFNGYQVLLAPMILKQSENTTGVTADKVDALVNLGSQLVKMSTRAVLYANDNNNQTLAAVLTITNSGYKNQSQNKKLIQAQSFFDALEANAPALVAYRITSDDIIALSESINTCRRNVLAPTTDSSSKIAATKAVKKFIKASTASLIIIDGLIRVEFSESDPDFVNEYFIKRQVDARGVRHTGIAVTFTEAVTGKIIEGATVSIELLNKKAISNINGMATIQKIRIGTYHINFAADGYVAQMQDVNVVKGKTLDIAMAMNAV